LRQSSDLVRRRRICFVKSIFGAPTQSAISLSIAGKLTLADYNCRRFALARFPRQSATEFLAYLDPRG